MVEGDQTVVTSPVAPVAPKTPSKGTSAPVPPPPVLDWDAVATTAQGVNTPITGGLVKAEDGTIIAYVGTDPDSQVNVFTWDVIDNKWTIETTIYNKAYPNQQGPVHDGQYRPRGIKYERKTRENSTEFTGSQFSGLIAKEGVEVVPVRTYKESLRRHIIRSGMWDVFYIQDPCNPAQKWDLFKKQARFPLEYVKEYVRTFRQTADKYALQNLEWSGEYMRNSLSSQLLAKVVEEVSVSASGPEMLVATMTIIYSGQGYDALEQCKNELKSLTLKQFPGENVVDLNKKVTALCERLDSADMMGPGDDLLTKIVKIYESSSEPRFNQWAYSTYDLVLKFVEACRVASPDVLTIDKFDYEKLVKISNKKYRDMAGANRWGPMLKSKQEQGEPTMPAGYMAVIQKAMLATLKQQGFAAGPTTKTPSEGAASGPRDMSTVVCHKCKKKGHYSRQCPDKKPGPTTGTQSDKTPPNIEWKYKLPAGASAATATTIVLKRTYKWCSKCNDGKGMFMYHHADGHDAWQTRRNSSEKPTENKANLAFTKSPPADYINFGSLSASLG
jgi:hypothetical protein